MIISTRCYKDQSGGPPKGGGTLSSWCTIKRKSIAHQLPPLPKLSKQNTERILNLATCAKTEQEGKRIPQELTADWMQPCKQPDLGPLKVPNQGLAFTWVGQKTYAATAIGPTPTAEVQGT